MRISDWSSDVCPSDLHVDEAGDGLAAVLRVGQHRTLRGVSFTRHGSFLFRAGPGPPFLSGGGSRPALRIHLALRALGAVLGAALAALGHAGGVERAAPGVVAHARPVLDAAAADPPHRVLRQDRTSTPLNPRP